MTSLLATGLTGIAGPNPLSAAATQGLPFRASLQSPAAQIYFDATIRESHGGQTRLTDHPVESGAVVTDHAINQPEEIEITGVISNRPIIVLASLNATPSVPGTDPRQRAESAYNEFVRWRETSTLLTVSTELRDYESMVIVSDATTRDDTTNEILQITLRLRKFRFATIEAVEAPEPADAVNKPKRNLGRQKTTDAPAEVVEKTEQLNESWLFKGASLFGP